MTKRASSSTAKEYLVVFGPALLIAFAGLLLAYFYVKPAPPDRIVISTRQADGAYYSYALCYREILARNSVILEIRQSAGSVENLQRLLAASEKKVLTPLAPGKSWFLWVASTMNQCGYFIARANAIRFFLR